MTDPVESPRSSEPAWATAVVLFVLAAYVLCLHGLGGFGFIGMEAMIADGGRHMVETGDWLTPYIYDELYTYKPPVAYWIAALPMAVSGAVPDEFLFRLPFAGSALLLGVVLFVAVGRRLGPRAGLVTAIAVLGTPLFAEKARIAEYDMPLAAAVGIAVAIAAMNVTRERPASGWWLVCYLALAAGVLTKGVPAVMAFGPGLLLAAWWSGRFRALFAPGHLAGAVLFVAVMAGYLVLAREAAGSHGFIQPIDEAKNRGFTWDLVSFGTTLAKPFLIALAFLPWSLVAVPVARAARTAPTHDPASRLSRAGLGFLAGGLFAFMAVPTHEMRYYLPLAASVALVAGPTVARWTAGTGRGILRTAVVVAVLVAALGWVRHVREPHGSTAVLAVATLACGVVLLPRFLRGRAVVACVAASCLVAVVEAEVFIPDRASSRALPGVAAELDGYLPRDATLHVLSPSDVAGKHGSLYLYLGRPVKTVKIDDPAPPGTWVLLSGEEHRHADAWGASRVAMAEQRGWHYLLARMPGGRSGGGGEPGDARAGEVR